MNRPAPHAPGNYELRVDGHLDQHWSAWFGGLTLAYNDDGSTTLRGPVTDQAALHGLLTKVRDLGVTLLSVTTIDAGEGLEDLPAAARPHHAPTRRPRKRRWPPPEKTKDQVRRVRREGLEPPAR